MPKVIFLRDFRGRATAEQHFYAGTVVDLEEWMVKSCLAEGAVERVIEPDEPAPAPPPPAPVDEAPVVFTPKKPGRPRKAKPAA